MRSLPAFRIRLSGISRALAACFPNPTVRAESRFPNPTVRAGSAVENLSVRPSDCPGRFCRRIKTRNGRVTDRHTDYVNLYIRYGTYLIQNGVTKVKPNINSVGVYLLLSHNGHLVGGRWFTLDQPVSAVPFENLFN